MCLFMYDVFVWSFVRLFVCLSVCLFVCMFVYLSVCLSVCMYVVCFFVCLFTCVIACVFVCLYACLLVFLFISCSCVCFIGFLACLFVYLFICCLIVYAYACSFIWGLYFVTSGRGGNPVFFTFPQKGRTHIWKVGKYRHKHYTSFYFTVRNGVHVWKKYTICDDLVPLLSLPFDFWHRCTVFP